jgi:hypothetical protein
VIGDRLELTVVNDKRTGLSGVSFPTPSEGWASGWTNELDRESEGVLWRYRDGRWVVWDTSRLGPDAHGWGIGELFFPSSHEGWGLGMQFPRADENAIESLLFRFDGGRWQPDPSMRAEGRLWSFIAMCSDPSGHSWAVGTKRQTREHPARALLVSREAGEWREIPVPELAQGGDDEVLNQTSCVPGGLVAAGWTGKPLSPSRREGVVLTYTGTWRRVPLPDHLRAYEPAAVAANSLDDFWVAGAGLGPLFLHYSAGQWQEVSPPSLPGGRTPRYSFSGMQFPTPDSGWAIANDLAGYAPFGLIFQYQNGSWKLRNWNWHFWHDRWFGLLGH